ncbi:MAG: PorT family protein [Paludibacteraceae bacterium]|nr:PorT family protein [Paludibacteraceae bacterium]
MSGKLRIFVLLPLLLAGAVQAHAQLESKYIRNLPQVDNQRWHFGFILGIGLGDFTTLPSEWTDANGNSYYSASNGLMPAFMVGMIADLRLCEYLNLRCTPYLTLGERRLNYTCFTPRGAQIGDPTQVSVKPTTVDVPFYLKYSGKRYGNVRPYILAGGGPQFNINLNPEEPILLNVFDVQIGFGVGLMIYNEYFRFCPELKFCFGLLDQLNRNHPEIDDTPYEVYTRSLDRLTSRMLAITFNFE